MEGTEVAEVKQKKFKCGDLVMLKSGSPVMTVSHYEKHPVVGDQIACSCFLDTDGETPGQFSGVYFSEPMLVACDDNGEPITEENKG